MKPLPPAQLGKNMEARRVSLGLTQTQVAQRAGLVQPTISGYEAGDFAPRLELWEVLAKALETTVVELFFDTGDEGGGDATDEDPTPRETMAANG